MTLSRSWPHWSPGWPSGAVSPRPAGLHCGPTNARSGRAGALGKGSRVEPQAQVTAPGVGAAQLRVSWGCIRQRAFVNSSKVCTEQHTPGLDLAGPRGCPPERARVPAVPDGQRSPRVSCLGLLSPPRVTQTSGSRGEGREGRGPHLRSRKQVVLK